MGKNTKIIITVLAVILVSAGALFAYHKNRTKPVSCLNCNVIIVGYDTVGAKHVSSLGYERKTTPNLDKMADQGFSFANNISAAPWTVPGFMAMFTSRHPTQHKVVNKYTVYNPTNPSEQVISNLTKLSPNTQTLTEQFKNQGYITGAFTADSGVSAKFGYSNGFDIYTETPPFGSIGTASTQAIGWLKKNPNKKFFMFLHGYDAHGQYKTEADFLKTGEFIPKDYKGPLNGSTQEEAVLREKQLSEKLKLSPADVEYLNGIYDTKIKDGDEKFGEFWKQFKQLGLEKNTVVVMVSDHGEEWYEHGGVDHGHTLYNELLNTPLVFSVPGAKPHSTITQQVTSIDIAPTLIDLVGITPNAKYKAQMQGQSLRPLFENKKLAAKDIYTETDYLDYTHIRGVQTVDGWKYIITEQTGKEELYDLDTDPGEKKNVIKSKANEKIAQDLRLKVRDHIIAMGDNPDKEWTTGCLPVYPTECQQ